jgi:hypothetical protein
MRVTVWRSILVAGACIAGCGTSERDPDDDQRGKADVAGSCATPRGDACGGEAPGGCWCDDGCVEIGDCCSDREEVCLGGACEQSDCPGGELGPPIMQCGAITAHGNCERAADGDCDWTCPDVDEPECEQTDCPGGDLGPPLMDCDGVTTHGSCERADDGDCDWTCPDLP